MTASRALTLRYGLMYGAMFLTIGIYLPFWPVWLSSKNLAADEIGLLLALGTWVKVLSNPVMAQVADRSGRAKATLAFCAVLSVATFSGFYLTDGFWPILAVLVLVNIFHPSLIPLTETQTMQAATAGRVDYGRARLWGSLAFILGTLGAGWALTGRDPGIILPLILGTLVLTALAALWFPPGERVAAPSSPVTLWHLFADRRFLIFLAAASFLSASHAVYYGFSALHWRAAGHSANVIGWLWAEGVIAEVILFAFAARAVLRFGPVGLLAIGAVGGILRWTILGSTTDFAYLLAAQVLHGATFGAAHLGAMHYLSRSAPPGLAASAQAVYSAVVGGLAIGFAMLSAGWLYDGLGGGAFHVMAAMSACGGILVFVLARR
jgi:PPP family 3-phenylpropionic acid transporter